MALHDVLETIGSYRRIAEFLQKNHLIENRSVNDLSTAMAREKKRGEKMGMSYAKFLKTNIEKMSTFRLSIMLMKTRELDHSLHHVDEKKRTY